MAESQTKGKTLNTWVQTVFIIVAGLWGIYAFIYKEMWVPAAAPINISMNVELKEIGSRPAGNGDESSLSAIEMRVSATNPSTRDVFLLANVWQAIGMKIAPSDPEDGFVQDVNALLKSQREGFVPRHSAVASSSVVATGLLFSDEVLRPKETIARTIVFLVPTGKYDIIEVQSRLPNVAQMNRVKVEWTFNEKEELSPKLFRLNRRGEPEAISDLQKLDPRIYFQSATSASQLSMWNPLKTPAD